MSATIDPHRVEERSLEPIAKLFIKNLMVPHVYLHPRWPKFSRQVDLLIIDRAGTGDVHIVEMSYQANAAVNSIKQLMSVPAAYRWIAFFAETVRPFVDKRLRNPQTLLPTDGPGKIGVIEVHAAPNRDSNIGDTLTAKVLVPAERFPGSYYDLAEKFVSKNAPDIEFR